MSSNVPPSLDALSACEHNQLERYQPKPDQSECSHECSQQPAPAAWGKCIAWTIEHSKLISATNYAPHSPLRWIMDDHGCQIQELKSEIAEPVIKE